MCSSFPVFGQKPSRRVVPEILKVIPEILKVPQFPHFGAETFKKGGPQNFEGGFRNFEGAPVSPFWGRNPQEGSSPEF